MLQGFEFMDPFVPVFVDNYNEKEMESCIEYYIHKKWIQNEAGIEPYPCPGGGYSHVKAYRNVPPKCRIKNP